MKRAVTTVVGYALALAAVYPVCLELSSARVMFDLSAASDFGSTLILAQVFWTDSGRSISDDPQIIISGIGSGIRAFWFTVSLILALFPVTVRFLVIVESIVTVLKARGIDCGPSGPLLQAGHC